MNKNDAATLSKNFEVGERFDPTVFGRKIVWQTLTNIVSASPSDIAKCPGLGQSKVRNPLGKIPWIVDLWQAKRLHDLFHQPFLAGKKTESSRQTLDSEEEETSQGTD